MNSPESNNVTFGAAVQKYTPPDTNAATSPTNQSTRSQIRSTGRISSISLIPAPYRINRSKPPRKS